jgi:hypothetical protein
MPEPMRGIRHLAIDKALNAAAAAFKAYKHILP